MRISVSSSSPVPADQESDRLATLASLDILDTPPEREFDSIVRAAQKLLGCKIALISLIDDERQWFKAKCGLATSETPREMAFCSHAIAARDIFIVHDATKDERFRNNPLVVGKPDIRFYAGVPIYAEDPLASTGPHPMGTLCVIDDKPRLLDAEQAGVLTELANLVEALLSARSAARTVAQLAMDRGEALRQLDRSHRVFRQAERMANIGSWRLTLADNSTEWSEQTYAIHGVAAGDGQGPADALDFYPPVDRAIIEGAIARTIATGEPFDVETDFRTAQGELRRVRSMAELELVNGVPVSLIGVFQDVTTRHMLEQALRQTADTDELTRIASRSRLNAVVDERIAHASAAGEPLALLLIDLDNFKMVNDRCGHLEGDDLLRLMASRLQASYLDGSFAARLGGDEFVLLVTSRRVLMDLPGLLRQLLKDLRRSISPNGETIHVSATIGACWLDDAIATRHELLQTADAALYEAKNAQRGSAKIAGRAGLIVAEPDATPRLRVIAG